MGEECAIAAATQEELLEAWQQANQYWLDRMQSEMVVWAELASWQGPAAFRAPSTPTPSVSQQLKMTAGDGQRLFSDFPHDTLTDEATNGQGELLSRAGHNSAAAGGSGTSLRAIELPRG